MASDGAWQAEHDGVQGATARQRLNVALEEERARLFLFAPVALGAGIAGYFALAAEPALWAAVGFLIFAVIVRFAVARGSFASVLIAGLTLSAAGFALAKLRVETVRAPVLERALRNVDVTGTVVRAETRLPHGQRLTISVKSIAGVEGSKLPALVRIRIPKVATEARPGDGVRVKANLSPPSDPVLPGGFDYARLAWFERLGAVGYAFKPPEVTQRDEAADIETRSRRLIEDIRHHISVRVRAALPGEAGAIATALITGERTGISEATNAAFKDSGLFHILSISGLHMVVMAGAVFFAVRLLLAAFPAIALRLPIKKIAAAAGIIAALLYLAISGGAFATVRSALMIVIMFTAVLLDRPALALRNVAIAAFVILAIYPESLLDAGFQMSFAAVTALIAVYEEVRRRFKRRSEPHPVLRVLMFFGGIMLSTVIASIAVAPFAAYHFHQSQQYAVIANLLAIPICNFVVMPAALLTLIAMPLGLESLPLYVMGLGIAAMTWCANLVAALPGAVGRIPAIPGVSFALMVAGGLWLLLWQTRLRLLGAASIVVGMLAAPWPSRPDMLIARGGEAVAVRDGGGLLSVVPGSGRTFEMRRWLEHDGDGRAPKAATGDAFTCDASGCVARVKGKRVAVARHPSAIDDDCARADILVLSMPRPKNCAAPALIVDVFDVWRGGTHAIYIGAAPGAQDLRVETVAAERGERPWTTTPERSKRRTISNLPKPYIVDAPDARARPSAPDDAKRPGNAKPDRDAADNFAWDEYPSGPDVADEP